MWLGFLGAKYRQPRPAPESVETAIARLTAAGPEKGVEVHRVGPAELILQDGESSTGVVFDEAKRCYVLTGVPDGVTRQLRPGDWAPGMSDYLHNPGIAPLRATLLAGRGVQRSIRSTLEPATGRWELDPTDNASQVAFDQLTSHGWHRTMPRKSAVVLTLIAILLVVAALALIGAAVWAFHAQGLYLIVVCVVLWAWGALHRRFKGS